MPVGAPGRPRYNAKVRAFLGALGGEAKLVAVEAARMAGYSNPRAAAPMLKRRYAEDVERVEKEWSERFRLSDDELHNITASIARNGEHKDQLKAIELVARMKGLLNDKVTVNIDRKTAQRELEEVLTAVQALASKVDDSTSNSSPATRLKIAGKRQT